MGGDLHTLGKIASNRQGPARWADLFEEHAPDALRLSYLLTGEREVAQDIAQDAFVRLFRRFQDLRAPEAFGPYLRRTIINLSRDHWRRVRLQRRFLRPEASRPIETDQPLSSLEARDEIWRALQRLPHSQRIAVILLYYEDLNEGEIAEAMGCSIGAVKSRLSRAISALRSHVSEDGS